MERFKKLVKREEFGIVLAIPILAVVFLLFGWRGVERMVLILVAVVVLPVIVLLLIALIPVIAILGPDLIRPLFRRRVSVTSEKFRLFLEEQIAALRPLGFFEEYSDTDDEILRDILIEKIQEQRREENVGDYLAYPALVGALDEKRVVWGDTERDLFPGNDEYIELLNELAAISRGRFQSENMREIWSEDEQEVTIEFELEGQTHRLQPKVDDDWLDAEIFTRINEIIKDSGYSFEVPRIDYGQDYSLVYVSAEEWKRLKELKW